MNVKDARGWTPLHYAASNNILDGMEAMIKLLLEEGADPSIKNNDGKTPLDVANEENQSFIPPKPVKPKIAELLSPEAVMRGWGRLTKRKWNHLFKKKLRI